MTIKVTRWQAYFISRRTNSPFIGVKYRDKKDCIKSLLDAIRYFEGHITTIELALILENAEIIEHYNAGEQKGVRFYFEKRFRKLTEEEKEHVIDDYLIRLGRKCEKE